MELSRAPVIASHSSARALASSSRNLEDEELQAVAATGGVVQTVAFNRCPRHRLRGVSCRWTASLTPM